MVVINQKMILFRCTSVGQYSKLRTRRFMKELVAAFIGIGIFVT